MKTVNEAKKLLFENISFLPEIKIKVEEATGFALSEMISAPFDVPLFTQSAMDGFAVSYPDNYSPAENVKFRIVGETKAGDKAANSLECGTAVRIFTGAPTPPNTFSVVMQEKVSVSDDYVNVPSSTLIKGNNIRTQGCEISIGRLAADKGTTINAAMAGFLSSMGYTEVQVRRKPIINILTTGNELCPPGSVLSPGQIYESNSFTLKSALHQCGFPSAASYMVKDDEKLLLKTVREMLEVADVVIISGGISVGKYDLVKQVLKKLGVNDVFYKVAQKPGKPLYFGLKDTKPVFALPGNPAAALVCFYEYILPAIQKMSGHANTGLRSIKLPLCTDFKMKTDRDLFLKARLEDNCVCILNGQESNILMSFAQAGALVFIPAGEGIIQAGSLVEVHILP